MIEAFNALLECLVTGLFTAGFLVFSTRMGWFPIMIVQAMTHEEYERREAQGGEDE